MAINIRTMRTSMMGLKTNNTTAAGLMSPMTTLVAQRFANFSSRLARVCARISKSLSEGVSASRYQPVESLDTRRSWRGRRRGDDEGVFVGVVEGEGDEMMVKAAAGRPVRSREVVFMLSVRILG